MTWRSRRWAHDSVEETGTVLLGYLCQELLQCCHARRKWLFCYYFPQNKLIRVRLKLNLICDGDTFIVQNIKSGISEDDTKSSVLWLLNNLLLIYSNLHKSDPTQASSAERRCKNVHSCTTKTDQDKDKHQNDSESYKGIKICSWSRLAHLWSTEKVCVIGWAAWLLLEHDLRQKHVDCQITEIRVKLIGQSYIMEQDYGSKHTTISTKDFSVKNG